MCFAVCSKQSLAMAFVEQTVAEDYLVRAKVSQNTIKGRKVIEPHCHKGKEMHISICWGRQGYRSVHTMSQAGSFKTRMNCLTSPTWSIAAGMLRASIGTWSLIYSNSLSIKIVWTIKPVRAYTQRMWWMRDPSFVAMRCGACSMVIRFMLCNTDTKKGNKLTNMTLTASVTLWFISTSARGISS
jgi:hypothetical protein